MYVFLTAILVELVTLNESYQDSVDCYGFAFVLHRPFIPSTDIFVFPVSVFLLMSPSASQP